VRELPREVEQAVEGRARDLHGPVLRTQNDAVLVVIDIGRILEIPVLPRERKRDEPQILPRRVVEPARVALVFGAELALGVARLRRQPRGRDGLRVLFGLREVDRDVERAVLARVRPLHVPRDAVAADVVRVLAEAVEPVGRGLGRELVQRAEARADLARPRRERAHELCIEQVPGDDIVLADPAAHGVGGQRVQQLRERAVRRPAGLVFVQLQDLQQPVGGVQGILSGDEPAPHGVAHERGNFSVCHP